jgi:uncharacterized protein
MMGEPGKGRAHRRKSVSEAPSMKNVVVWSDIPVADLGRAAAFYAAVLGMKVEREEHGGTAFCLLEHSEGNGGCLVLEPGEVSAVGTLNYFNVNGRIEDAVEQVRAHGGKVLQEPHPIGPYGIRAVVLDSEGNRLALHSSPAH